MKNYLLDVAVKTNIWIREDCQRRSFEVIKKVRPSVLFLQSDGGRNEDEWKAIRANREIYEKEIDWQCTVYKIYSDTNEGMYTMGIKSNAFVWNKVDQCIFFEDDILPSESFFWFCEEMLERYKDDKRIYAVCGMNHLGINEDCSDDYFFSRYGSVWGLGLWKRSYEQYRFQDFRENQYYQKLLLNRTRNCKTHRRQIESIIATGGYDNHVPGSEFYMNLAVYGHNQLFIIPKYNMICEMGYGEKATHSDSLERLPKAIRKISNMKTYDIDFPTSVPKYVIPDIEYEEKRNLIMGLDHPLIQKKRRLERGLLVLKTGDLKYIFNKIFRRKWEK